MLPGSSRARAGGIKCYMRTPPIVLAVCAATLLSAPTSADCDRPRNAVQALAGAAIAFRGLAREVTAVGVPGSWRGWVVAFRVFSVWKGAPTTDFTLYITALSEDDAYEEFRQGEQYVVFADINSSMKSDRFGVKGTTYGAHGCGGTGPVAQQSAYLKELGPGKPKF